MSNQFKKGDKVRLKGGGPTMNPVMVIKSIDEKGVTCTWFDAKGELKEAVFEPETLNLYVAPQPKKFRR